MSPGSARYPNPPENATAIAGPAWRQSSSDKTPGTSTATSPPSALASSPSSAFPSPPPSPASRPLSGSVATGAAASSAGPTDSSAPPHAVAISTTVTITANTRKRVSATAVDKNQVRRLTARPPKSEHRISDAPTIFLFQVDWHKGFDPKTTISRQH